jgi:hypothetical protein
MAPLRPDNTLWTNPAWDNMLPRVTLCPGRHPTDLRKLSIVISLRAAKLGDLIFGNFLWTRRGAVVWYVLPAVIIVVIQRFFGVLRRRIRVRR